MKTKGQIQASLGNGDQHVCADCDLNLRLDRVLVGAIKRLDAQVLLDTFEKQFDLPALEVQVRDQSGFEGEVLGQKSYSFALLDLDDHTSQDGLGWNKRWSANLSGRTRCSSWLGPRGWSNAA